MMRITRILCLRDCGIFRDFAWPEELPAFGRYNLIYGWNGTGKTTLSRILRCLEKRTTPEGRVEVESDNGRISGDEFPNAAVPVRVFNREFITENVFPVGGGYLQPIFVLGAESVERQKEVERLKDERAAAQAKLESADTTWKKAEKDFDQFCIDRARAIKERLRSSGENRYNNYDKSDFRRDAESMAKAGDGSSHRLTDAERGRLQMQHLAPRKSTVREVSYELPDPQRLAEQVRGLLQKTVVSAAIQKLKDDPALAQWVRHGLGLHRERGSDTCLFCEQPLPADRLSELTAHFNIEYEQLVGQIDEEIQRLESARKQATDLRVPDRTALYDDLATQYDAAVEAFQQALAAVRAFLGDLIKALNEKQSKPFEATSLSVTIPTIDAAAVNSLNEVIGKHNQACDEFDKRVMEARRKLAEDSIAEVLSEFISRRDALQKAKKEKCAAEDEVRQLDKNIARLEREIVEHRRPAEELNEDLRKYLGHDELRLEVKDTGYTITRRGEPASALSEGEMTAVALLYFLKSLQDKNFDLATGVVVLDDPVSSLDANALYLAFGFIRECTERAGQLIIFTHNFTLFRQARNWFHHLKGQNKSDVSQRPARFYMLECARDPNGRCATIRRLDPLLEQYDSDYHYLFASVYRAANATEPTRLGENYALPNMARRLLEAFLAFRQPEIAESLWQKLQKVPFDNAKKIRIIRFLHTHSHSSAVGEPEHDLSLLAEAGSVLKDLVELIEAQDKAHFDAMVKLVTSQTAEEDDQ